VFVLEDFWTVFWWTFGIQMLPVTVLAIGGWIASVAEAWEGTLGDH
jgi:hypothetical protein